MTTVSASLQMFQRISQTLKISTDKATMYVEEKLRQTLQLRITVILDLTAALAKIDLLRKRIRTLSGNVVLKAKVETSMPKLRLAAIVRAEVIADRGSLQRLQASIRRLKPQMWVQALMDRGSLQQLQAPIRRLKPQMWVQVLSDRGSLRQLQASIRRLKPQIWVQVLADRGSLQQLQAMIRRLKPQMWVQALADRGSVQQLQASIRRLKPQMWVQALTDRGSLQQLQASIRRLKPQMWVQALTDRGSLQQLQASIRRLKPQMWVQALMDRGGLQQLLKAVRRLKPLVMAQVEVDRGGLQQLLKAVRRLKPLVMAQVNVDRESLQRLKSAIRGLRPQVMASLILDRKGLRAMTVSGIRIVLDTAGVIKQAKQLRNRIAGILDNIHVKTNAQKLGDLGNTIASQDANLPDNQPAAASQKQVSDKAPKDKAPKDKGGDKPDNSKVLDLAMQGAKYLGTTSIQGGLEQQKLMDTFIARTGNVTVGTSMFAKFKQEAMKAGVDVKDSLEGTLSLFNVTKDTNQLTKLNKLANRMNAFDPEGKGEGVDILKDAMSGDTESLAKKFDISDKDMKASNIEQLGKSGDINGLINAFDKLLEKQKMGEDAYNKMMSSPIKQMDKLKNNFQAGLAGAGQAALGSLMPAIQKLNEAFDSGKFQPFFNVLSAGLQAVGVLVDLLASAVLWVADAFQSNWPVFISVLAAIGAMLFAMIAPLLVQAALWLLMNWPILLIGLLIGMLVYALQSFGVTTAQVVGFVVGSFTAFGAMVWNVIAFLWDIIASFAEFLINSLYNSSFQGQQFFYDLATAVGTHVQNMIRSIEDFAGEFQKQILVGVNGALGGINALIKAFNKLTGNNIGTIDLFKTDNVHAISDRLGSKLSSMENPADKKPKAFEFGRMPVKNLKDAYDYGDKAGQAFVNKLNFDLPKIDQDAMNKWNLELPARGASGADAAAGGTDMGNAGGDVDVSDEDISLMRDVAMDKNIQNFVTLTPTVTLEQVHNYTETDVNEMIRRIEVEMEQAFANSARGVYGN